MTSFFDGTKNMEDMGEIYKSLKANCPCPSSTSKKLWKLRRKSEISDRNDGKEKILEKAVAMLAEREHMPGWFNQCPAASGILRPTADRNASVDLVHWDESNKHARLVELKWGGKNDDPCYALREVLRYGAAYVFCRIHRGDLPLQGRPLMDACHVSLEVAAPARYYRRGGFADALDRMRNHLDAFDIGSRIDGLEMSLDALAFPKDFDQVPFADGAETEQECNTTSLTPKGKNVRDAFESLKPVKVDGK